MESPQAGVTWSIGDVLRLLVTSIDSGRSTIGFMPIFYFGFSQKNSHARHGTEPERPRPVVRKN
jgi:hypothetical protein